MVGGGSKVVIRLFIAGAASWFDLFWAAPDPKLKGTRASGSFFSCSRSLLRVGVGGNAGAGVANFDGNFGVNEWERV